MNRFIFVTFGLNSFMFGAKVVINLVKKFADVPYDWSPYWLIMSGGLTLFLGLILWGELNAS